MGPSGRSRELGVSAWITRAVLQELESRGIDGDPVLARHGLTRRKLFDPDAWVAHRRHRAFYREAIRASRDPAFQIAVGRRVPVHVTRVAGYCAAYSRTLREACESFGRFAELVVDGAEHEIRSTNDFDAVRVSRPASAQLPEDGPSYAVSILDFFAHATGRPVKPLAISLPGPEPEGSEVLEAALGASITWEADDFEIRFPPGTLDTPVDQADPVLREALEDIARREVAMRIGGSAVTRVRAAILQFGFEKSAAIGQTAARLGTTSRTLQRWLAQESRTYSEVREEVLREAALSMFAVEGAAVDEIALRLGFSSRGGFHRAIKRWTGKTPGGLRARPRRRQEG
jgi:AraC-like DNA-binding protein